MAYNVVYEKRDGPPLCSFCKTPGHKFYYCWAYREYQQRKCFACGEVGHMRRDCAKLLYNCIRCDNGGHYASQCQQVPPKGNNRLFRRVAFGRDQVFEVEKLDLKAIWKDVVKDQKDIKAAEAKDPKEDQKK